MEGDQSSRDMTAFGYRQKNYAQGCRQQSFSDQGAIILAQIIDRNLKGQGLIKQNKWNTF